MQRFLIVLGLLALILAPALRADADSAFALAAASGQPVAAPLSPAVIAFDADDRFAAPHDLQGVITYFNRFNMTLRVDGQWYPVVLHQGTIIRPTGTTLEPSMVVNVSGYWSAGTFYANRIVVVRS